MQQLSLFDFGDDTPKQEKKKKPSQKDTSPSKKEGNNDAVADNEVLNAEAAVPNVPDQIINEPPADNSNGNSALENEQSAEDIDNQSINDPALPEAPEKDQEWDTEAIHNPAQIPAQQPLVNEIKAGQDIANNGQLTEPETQSAESDANNSEPSPEANTQDKVEDSEPASGPQPAPESSQTVQNSNHDIVFSDEQIIVKFKPKSNGVNIENKPTSIDPEGLDKPVVEELDAPNTENEETEATAEADQSGTNALDTSFPPVAETKSDDQKEEEVSARSQADAHDDSQIMANEEAEAAEGQIQTNDASLDSKMEADQTSDEPTAPESSDQRVDKEELAGVSTATIDLNHTETGPVKPAVHVREETKATQPAIAHKRGRKSFKEIDAEVDLIDVPSDEELFKKQYYPISVVAKWFRVNNSLLRFWENEFKILKPKKNKKGDRFFRPEDVKNLQIIYYLLRQKKLTINGAIKHLKSKKEHTEVNLQIIQSLGEFKSFLLELRATTEK